MEEKELRNLEDSDSEESEPAFSTICKLMGLKIIREVSSFQRMVCTGFNGVGT